MNRTKKSACTKADAAARVEHAVVYLNVAELALSDQSGPESTVATGNAVLAGIAASDAICCALAGSHLRGGDHRKAAKFLREVTGNADLSKALRDLIDFKDQAHYVVDNVKAERAKAAIRRARTLVEAAQRAVRG